MRMRFWIVAPLITIFGGSFLALAQNPSTPSGTAASSPTEEIVVPANTTIPLVLKNTINSRTAYVGQSIYCETIYPIAVNDRIAIPVGSYVRGRVTQVVRPGRIKGKAQLGIRFDSITLANGVTRPLRATLSSFADTGNEGFSRRESKVEGASSKGRDAGRITRATITGAEIGTIAGIGSHHSLKGLGIGSIAGAGAGAIWVAATHGKEILLPRGTNLELQLNDPLAFNPADLNR